MEHNAFVEIVNDGRVVRDGGYGNIIVTAKNNLVMPFIRYDTGDVGRICQTACQCGNRGAVLELSGARSNDMVVLDSGETVSANLFCRIFQEIAWRIEGRIFQYRVEQMGVNLFVVSIATDEREEDIERLFCYLIGETDLRDAEFRFVFDKYLLPEMRTGKFKFFINHMQGEV